MSNKIDIEIAGDDLSILRAWQRQFQAVDKLDAKMDKLTRSSKRASMQTKGGFDSALGSFSKFAGAVTGVGGALSAASLAARQVLVEFRNIKDLQKTDADKQVEFENSLVQTIRNAGDFFGADEIKKRVLDLSTDAGVRPVITSEVLSSTLSARGATNQAQAEEAFAGTKAAINFAPELNAADASVLAGASVDIAKKTGYTPEESVGLAQNVASLAHVSEMKDIAQNVAPAMNALIDFGNSAQEAGSLISAITQGTQDFTGASSRTAAIQLAKQLKERGIGSDTAEGIQMLQQDPKLRKKFLEGGSFNGKQFPGASFEQGAYTTMHNLMNAQSDLAKSFSEGIKLVGGRAEAQEKYDSTVAKVKTVTRTSRMERELQAMSDVANIKDVQGGEGATARKVLEESLKAANFSDARQKTLMLDFETKSHAGTKNPTMVAEQILEKEIGKRLATTQMIDVGDFAGGGLREMPRKVTEADKATAAALRPFEMLLEKFIKEAQPKPAAAPQQAPQALQGQAGDVDLLQAMNTLTEAIRQAAIKNGVPLVPERTPPRKLAVEKLNRGER